MAESPSLIRVSSAILEGVELGLRLFASANNIDVSGTDGEDDEDSVPKGEANCCPKCYEEFSDGLKAPRALRCGHCMCGPCVVAILRRPMVERSCPQCGTTMKFTSVDHLPISYTALRLSRTLVEAANSQKDESTISQVVTSLDPDDVCPFHGNPLVEYCQDCNSFTCKSCPDCTSEKEPIGQVLAEFKEEEAKSATNMVKALEEVNLDLESRKDEVTGIIKKLKKKIAEIDATLDDVNTQVQDVEASEAQVVGASSGRRLIRAVARSKKVEARSQELLKDCDLSQSTIPPSVTQELLKTKLAFISGVYAEHNSGEEKRFARVYVEDSKLVVCHYEATPPPDSALTFTDRTLYTCYEARAFLDISDKRQLMGRVEIVMINTASGYKTTHFLKLCCGRDGQSYRGLHFVPEFFHSKSCVQIGREITEIVSQVPRYFDGCLSSEYVNYEVFPGLIAGMTTKPDTDLYPTPATFTIHPFFVGMRNEHAFAKVISGLNVVRSAVSNFTQHVVTDCGLVIDLYRML